MKSVLFFSLILTTSLLAQRGVSRQKQHWKLVDASSENVITGEMAIKAFDDDLETQWHTRWHDARGGASAPSPHFITIDLQAPLTVYGFRIRTRAHGEGGFPKKFLFETSLDGKTWEMARSGEFTFRSRMSPHATVGSTSLTAARFVRLTIDSIHDSPKSMEPGLAISEIDIATHFSRFKPTTTIPVPQSREWNYGGYHWRKRHLDLIEYSKTTKGDLVFIGDSITHRWGAPPFDETPTTGKAIWDQFYAHRQALNLGYGWDRVENMIWRIHDGELDHVDPRLVVVMAGTNNLEVNTPDEIAAGVRHLCSNIHQQCPKAKILLLAVFPRGQEGFSKELIELNKLLAKLDSRPFITFKDIGSVFLNDQGKLTRDIMPDLLHPGEEGYRRWAEAIEPEISKILGDKIRN
ncbi:MAG: hypothetical protein HOI66_03915 [Verrucomicrobia bacterium]|nr:hypothetical protein [Verrucomicrobiota bacterium]